MSGRNLTNLAGFQNRTLTGLSNIITAETNIDNIKTKYNFDATVSTGNLLIGNSIGNYTSSRLTAGDNITITNTSGNISIASTDTNFFEKTNNNIRTENTTDNLLLGTTFNLNDRKLVVNGTTHIIGTLFLGDKINNLTIPGFVTDTFCLIGATQTLTNKSISYDQLTSTPTIPSNNNQLTNGAGYITASSTQTLTNKTLTTPKINDTSSNHTYNFTVSELLANREINLPLLVSNDIFVFQDHAQELKNKGLFDPIITGLTSGSHNPRMRIHDANLTHFYNIKTGDLTENHDVYLPSISGTDVNSFVVNYQAQALYNKDLTSATNTFPTLNQSTTGNSATATKITSITNSNIVQLTETQSLTNKTINNPLLTGSINSTIFRLHDKSLNQIYSIKTGELLGNQIITIPAVYNDTGEFCITNATQVLENKTIRQPNITTTTPRNMLSFLNGSIVIGNTSENTEITRGRLIENTLTGTTGVAGIRLYIEDQSINHFYNLKVSELTANRDIRLPVLLNNDGHFVVNNVAQSLTNKSIPSITNNTFGIDVASPRTTLDLARNYPADTTSTSGEATNIFLNTKNSIGASSGLVWAPNFNGYSKTSAYINFMPTGNFFRGELHFGANFISDQTSAARKVMKISQYGQYLYANGITFSPVSTGNNWSPLAYWEGNVISSIGGGALNNGGATRKFVWAIESTSGSFRALGLFANNSDANTTTSDITASGFTFIGFFSPFSKNTQFSFTASHRCFSNNNDLYNEDMIGLIVESTGEYDSLYKNPIIDEIENNENDNIEEIILDDGATIDEVEEIEEIEEIIDNPIIDNPIIDDSENYNIDIDNAVPIVDLCKSRKSKKVLGVIAKYEKDGDNRQGMDFGFIQVADKDKNRLYINSIGEGGIWVCNTNGNFENGDYIQSSNIAGYGELQDDDILHNYSVAKITCDMNFDNIPKEFQTRTLDNNVIAVFVGAIYQQG